VGSDLLDCGQDRLQWGTLRHWVRRHERDAGLRDGMTSEVRDRLKVLERENRELRQANEILRKASAYFAQAELDRRFKP
jgi:transposase